MKTTKAGLCLVLATLACTTTVQATDSYSDGWQHSLSLYGWLPSLDGSMKFEVPPGSGSSVGVDASKILDALEGVFMGTYQARQGKWSFIADMIYLDLGNTKDSSITLGPNQGISVSSRVDLRFTGFTGTALGGYRLSEGNGPSLDLLGGLRVFSYKAETDLTLTAGLPGGITTWPASVSKSETLLDAVIGARGEIPIDSRWSVPYYIDLGTGDSDLTWQAMTGIEYRADWGDLALQYRHLAYDQADNKFLQDFSFSGPQLGVKFHF